MSRVTVIDYGMGNLLSVQRALEHLGANVATAAGPDQVDLNTPIVLPGVGAFGDGMQALQERQLPQRLQAAVENGAPLLGICLGAQMLLEESEEFGSHTGLGLIPGRVAPIPDQDMQGRPLKRPHMGWSDIRPPTGADFDSTLLASTPPGSAVYFVHSFQAVPDNPGDIKAVCEYGGQPITALVQHANIMGCQFHPEKSGLVGLLILQRFLEFSA